MVATLTKQLADVLNQENEIYETLSKISNNKTELVVGGKVNELENITRIEQSLVIKIAKLEDDREKLVDKLCALLGARAEDITISALVERLGQDQADELKACQAKIINTIKNLKKTNDLNAKLIKNSLEYIDFSINMMTSIDTVNNSYGSSGFSGEAKKRNFFDMKL
ncbi:FlgN protein [Ruminiclostridium sufflavum DSM 19573]|uniref:FlgN protein n=1 Tax=Ruminiclostridium sufflavum DSM 19573 TaxID=1121337 RepID=A0A318XPK3_9FIRM|nr:flagellar protein FlgN [Ruminiclostridium sufflavum]PYG89110.1 FlgN protein [Ruminiclostridium sufflavum DSM 19573]